MGRLNSVGSARTILASAAVLLLVGCTPNQAVSTATPSAPPVAISLGRADGLVYMPIPAKRVVDTRAGSGYQGAGQRLGANTMLTAQLAGTNLAPPNAGAVVMTVTILSPSAPGFLTVYPAGSNRPNVLNLIWRSGETVSNLVTVRLGDGGQVDLYSGAASVDVVADLDGYYAPPVGSSSAGRYFTIPPFRLVDTRQAYPLGTGASRAFKVAGAAVPAAAEAVVLNVTATNVSARSYLAVVPGELHCSSGAASSCVATWNLTWVPGAPVSNRVITPLGKGPDGTSGWISFFNLAGSADLLVDVEGWYGDSTVPGGMGSTFTPINPCRALDHQAVQGSGYGLQLVHTCGIPTGSTAAVVNVRVDSGPMSMAPIAPGCVMPGPDLAWPTGREISSYNQIALTDGAVVASGSGSISVDVSGYFSPGSVRQHLLCLSYEERNVEPLPQSSSATVTAFDTMTGRPVETDPVTITLASPPAGAACPRSSLASPTEATDGKGTATIAYNPSGPGICLITVEDPTGGIAATRARFGLLRLAREVGGSRVIVTATYLRADGSPHAGAAIDFQLDGSSLGGGPIGPPGRCVTDATGRCTYSYSAQLSGIVFANDSTGLQDSISG
jgi:hypothetical protein